MGTAGAADSFPSRPIKIIIAASAGGSLGAEIRAITPFLEKYLRVKTVVEFLPGAGGIIGFNKAYNAKPDGYTIIHGTPASAIATELTRNTANYVVKNLSPVAAWTIKHHSLLVHPDSWKNFAEFLEEGKKRNISIAGVNGSPDIQARLLGRSLGIEFNMIPYNSGGEGTAATAGKHVEAAITYTTSARSMVQAGTLKPLTIFSVNRDRILPDVPSIAELGYGKVPLLSNAGAFMAPPNTPKEILAILEKGVRQATDDPEFINLAQRSAVVPEFRSTAELRKMIAECYELLNTHRDLIK